MQPSSHEMPIPQKIADLKLPDLDLGLIKTQAVEAYRSCTKFEFPEDIARNFRHLSIADEIGISNSPYSSFFREIIKHLPASLEVHIPWRSMSTVVDPDVKEVDITNVATQLTTLGIPASSSFLQTQLSDESFPKSVKDIYKSPDNDLNIFEFLFQMQEEYYRVLHAMRIMYETRAILQKAASFIPWPSRNIFPFASENVRWEPNGFWYPVTPNDHAIGILEQYIDPASIMHESRETHIRFTGQLADKYIIAAHEAAGHAGFAEMYNPSVMKEVFREYPALPNIATLLSEGYAIFIEELAARAVHLPGKRIYFYDTGVSESREAREQYLADVLREDPSKKLNPFYFSKRNYTHGVSLIRQLLSQHGLSNAPSEIQLQSLRTILQTVDLQKAANIWYEQPDYLDCLVDPTHKLPRVV